VIHIHRFLQLDAGTDERIMLVSRDEQSCLVVSYKDIKLCVQSAFEFVPSILS
jgi:PAB-dependent poly(A)-specific ribonuclease subunit 3